MQRIHRRVYGGGRVRHGVGVRPPDSGGRQVHQLRRPEAEQRPLLEARRVVLQLPRRSSGQPLPPRLQPHYSLPLLNFPLSPPLSFFFLLLLFHIDISIYLYVYLLITMIDSILCLM
ncbi:unnamed protein product [Linum tenue]|uniref:Uncharacterized protein n=1 Tax=Linum tenue TaxID=586396 RepID=A0AAV0P8C3_9ROSI|nr:unnamed protein product [Linum tenue]